MINTKLFYNKYEEVFGVIKNPKTNDTLDAILQVFRAHELDITTRAMEKFSYMLATVKHEVGEDMLPIVENMNYTSISRIRAVWPSRFPTNESAIPYIRNPESLGNRVYGGRMGNGLLEGYKYRGRGIGAQLTGFDNYKVFSDLLGIDLVGNPDLAMDVNTGSLVLYFGCMNGLFTGKKLERYINDKNVDYVNARACVNSDIKLNGANIAALAQRFQKCMSFAMS